MTAQFNFFDGMGGADNSVLHLPDGFIYWPELIGTAEEDALLSLVRELPFREFEFHGYKGKRRVVSFGTTISLHVISGKQTTFPNTYSRCGSPPPHLLGWNRRNFNT